MRSVFCGVVHIFITLTERALKPTAERRFVWWLTAIKTRLRLRAAVSGKWLRHESRCIYPNLKDDHVLPT